MFEYSADPVSATPTATPWLIPLFLIVAALAAFFRPHARNWTLEAALLSAATAALHVAFPVSIAHLATAIRIGSLDVSLSLWLDALSSATALALALAGAVAIAVFRRAEDKRPANATALATGAALLAVLADSLPLVLLGWSGMALAGWIVADEEPVRRFGFVVARLGELALLSGGILLAWGLGGSFGESRAYTPDFRARMVSVEPSPSSHFESDARQGYLSMLALPGARVLLGDADLCEVDGNGKSGGIGTPAQACRRVARSPFTHLSLPAAIHEVRILPGAGAYELRIDKVRVNAGQTSLLALTGPTLSFSEIATQLTLRDASGEHVIRSALVARRIAGVPLVELALSLMVLGIAARALLFPFGAGRPSLPIALLGQGAAVYLALRLAPLLLLAPVASALLVTLGCVTALVAAENAARQRSTADLTHAVSALALVASSVGAHAAGAAILFVLLPAAFVLHAARQAGHLLAARLTALSIAAAPVPLLGGFGAREALLWGAFRQQNAAYVPGWLVALIVLAAWSALALGAWRSVLDTKPKKTKRKAKTQAGALLVATALLAFGAGALSVSLHAFGGRAASLLEVWLAPSLGPVEPTFEPAPLELRLAWLVAGFGLAFAAWFVARRLPVARAPWPSLRIVSRVEERLAKLASLGVERAAGAAARVDGLLEGRAPARDESS